MNNIMRQMGKKEQAFEYVWKQIEECMVEEKPEEEFTKPLAVEYYKEQPQSGAVAKYDKE